MSRMLFTFLLLTIPSAARGQDAASEPRVVPPELLKFEEAKLPPDLDVAPGQYVITLAVTVSETGAVTDVQVTASDSEVLSPFAREAVSRFSFRPALVDGNPVPVQITYRYSFNIKPRERVVVFVFDVSRKGDREPVDGVTAIVEENGRSFTAVDGRIAVSDLAPGTWTLYVPEDEYAEVRQKFIVEAGTVGRAPLKLERRFESSRQTVIRAPKEARFVAKQSLEASEIRRMPGAAGDPLKTVENLPGIARPPFGAGMLVVYGANFLDTQVLLDSMPMWWFYHFGGVYSTIHPDFIDRIDFVPAGFDGSYGLATGGIIDVHLREEPLKRFHAAADVNLIHAGAIVGVPYSPDGHIRAAFRRSYIDAVLKAVIPEGDTSLTSAPRYYDYQFEWLHRFGPRHRLQVFANGSDDAMGLLVKRADLDDPAFVGGMGFSMWIHGLTAKYTAEPSPALRNVLTAKVLGMGFDLDLFKAIHLVEKEIPFHLREDLQWRISDRLRLVLGLEGMSVRAWTDIAAPPVPGQGAVDTPFSTREVIHAKDDLWVGSLSPFASLEWQALPGWWVVPSVRLDGFFGDYTAVSFDPRLSTRWQVSDTVSLRLAGGLYQQPPPVYTFSKEFGGGNLGPEAAIHALVGGDWTPVDRVTISANLFYKWLFHLAEPSKDRTIRYTNDGKGRAFGGDVLIRVSPGGRFVGFLTYSYVVAQRWDFATGAWRSADTDQRHTLNVLGTYELPRHWSIGGRFRLGSGSPYTPVIGTVFDADADRYSPIPATALNSARVPLYHTLDLRMDKEWLFDAWKLGLYLEVQNVYNHRCAEGVTYNHDYSKRQYVTGLPILPVFGMKGEF